MLGQVNRKLIMFQIIKKTILKIRNFLPLFLRICVAPHPIERIAIIEPPEKRMANYNSTVLIVYSTMQT